MDSLWLSWSVLHGLWLRVMSALASEIFGLQISLLKLSWWVFDQLRRSISLAVRGHQICTSCQQLVAVMIIKALPKKSRIRLQTDANKAKQKKTFRLRIHHVFKPQRQIHASKCGKYKLNFTPLNVLQKEINATAWKSGKSQLSCWKTGFSFFNTCSGTRHRLYYSSLLHW